jgi:hypothetical protein
MKRAASWRCRVPKGAFTIQADCKRPWQAASFDSQFLKPITQQVEGIGLCDRDANSTNPNNSNRAIMIDEEPAAGNRARTFDLGDHGPRGGSFAGTASSIPSDDERRRRRAIAVQAAIDTVVAFNIGVALVGCLWLAVTGNALELELSDFLVMPPLVLIFALVLVPAIFIVSLRTWALSNRRRLFARVCYFAMYGWAGLVVALWCVSCFRMVSWDLKDSSFWPSLLFAYGMAALPGQWLLMGAPLERRRRSMRSAAASLGARLGAYTLLIISQLRRDVARVPRH